MVKRCFVPFCKTGRKSNLPDEKKFSLFKAPNDKALLEKWREKIPMRERELDSKDRICEKHFEKHFVQPRWLQSKFGEYFVDHIRPKLTPDAVPTIFPDLDPKGTPVRLREPKTSKSHMQQKFFHNIDFSEVEVNENDYVSVCYKCLIQKCSSHIIFKEEHLS